MAAAAARDCLASEEGAATATFSRERWLEAYRAVYGLCEAGREHEVYSLIASEMGRAVEVVAARLEGLTGIELLERYVTEHASYLRALHHLRELFRYLNRTRAAARALCGLAPRHDTTSLGLLMWHSRLYEPLVPTLHATLLDVIDTERDARSFSTTSQRESAQSAKGLQALGAAVYSLNGLGVACDAASAPSKLRPFVQRGKVPTHALPPRKVRAGPSPSGTAGGGGGDGVRVEEEAEEEEEEEEEEEDSDDESDDDGVSAMEGEHEDIAERDAFEFEGVDNGGTQGGALPAGAPFRTPMDGASWSVWPFYSNASRAEGGGGADGARSSYSGGGGAVHQGPRAVGSLYRQFEEVLLARVRSYYQRTSATYLHAYGILRYLECALNSALLVARAHRLASALPPTASLPLSPALPSSGRHPSAAPSAHASG